MRNNSSKRNVVIVCERENSVLIHKLLNKRKCLKGKTSKEVHLR